MYVQKFFRNVHVTLVEHGNQVVPVFYFFVFCFFGVWLYFSALFGFLYWIDVQTEVRVDENNIRLVSTPHDTEELFCVHGSAADHALYV